MPGGRRMSGSSSAKARGDEPDSRRATDDTARPCAREGTIPGPARPRCPGAAPRRHNRRASSGAESGPFNAFEFTVVGRAVQMAGPTISVAGSRFAGSRPAAGGYQGSRTPRAMDRERISRGRPRIPHARRSGAARRLRDGGRDRSSGGNVEVIATTIDRRGSDDRASRGADRQPATAQDPQLRPRGSDESDRGPRPRAAGDVAEVRARVGSTRNREPGDDTGHCRGARGGVPNGRTA